MIVNVQELMTDTDFTRTITRQRPTTTRAVDGSASNTFASTDIIAIVQPATAKEIAALPEGTRGPGEMITVWSATEMRLGDGKTFEADVLVIDGHPHRIVGAEDWSASGYFKVLAERYVAS